MRQRNTTGADSSSSDDQATSIKPVAAAPTSPATEKRAASHGHSHGHHHDDEDEHDHDHPIDEEKLDNLLWEISKFCIPVGFVLYLSIYLCYRHELLKWFSRPSTTPSTASHPYLSVTPFVSAATVDAPAPTAGDSPEAVADKFERWVKKEEKVAWAAMAANIGPGAGASDGVVVAASSRGEWEDEPDYHFTWTRDSALIISTFLPRFLPTAYLRSWAPSEALQDIQSAEEQEGEPDYLVEGLVRAYIASQAAIQGVSNPSGDLWTGGLNEPKFHVDGSAFTGSWGRPQRDGPALRALSLIPYANFLLDREYHTDIDYVSHHLYDPAKLRELGKVIKNDLEEVGGGWWNPGFDLWEEVNGHHLFTLLVSLRALQAGANLAFRLNDTGAADFYLAQSAKIVHRLPDFWNDSHSYYRATLPATPPETGQVRIGSFTRKERTSLDCAVPLAILHAGDAAGGDWSAADDRILATLRAWVLSFDGVYGINKGRKWTEGWAVGRYAEDVYNGIGTSKGNPWFICTFSVAEMLYRARSIFEQQAGINVTDISAPFWSDVLGETVAPGALDLAELSMALEKLGVVGDAFLQAGTSRVAPDGRMSEQIDRSDGTQVGARDLTWSYASFIAAIRARRT